MNNNNLHMFDIEDENKRLILRSAYFAVLQDNWKRSVFQTVSNAEERQKILGNMPCGSPMSNLMELAAKLLIDFNKNLSGMENIEIIKHFIFDNIGA